MYGNLSHCLGYDETAGQVLRGEDYTFSADVYSMGVIVWEMLARQQV
eukprot:COSAG01_NODE_2405_length_7756_cov_2.156589_8_plen_47_part_00